MKELFLKRGHPVFAIRYALAPFVDSMEWWVNANETITIAPNFDTDPDVPGYDYVVVKISESGQSFADTITCTGSTLGVTGITENESETIELFPNPSTNNIPILLINFLRGL